MQADSESSRTLSPDDFPNRWGRRRAPRRQVKRVIVRRRVNDTPEFLLRWRNLLRSRLGLRPLR